MVVIQGWENLYNNGEDFLINVINKNSYFGKPPKHEFLTFIYGNVGSFETRASINEDYLKMLNHFNREIYVCGEHIQRTGWIEVLFQLVMILFD